MFAMPTASLPVTRMPSPAECPLTSADGECTRRNSADRRAFMPSAKRTVSSRERRWCFKSVGGGICRSLIARCSEDVAAQVFVLHERVQMRVDVRRVDDDALATAIGGLEAHALEQALEHRVQAPRTDVLAAVVDLERDLGEPAHAARLKLDVEPLRREQALVLLREGRGRLGENPHEVIDAERGDFV